MDTTEMPTQPPPAVRPASTAASLVAGSVGGMAQVLTGNPLDVLKTRAQLAAPGQFKGTADIALQTFRNEGALAFYKGVTPPLVGIAAVNSLLFGANTVARRMISPFPDRMSIAEVAAAGSIAGAVQAVLASPVEMFKVHLAAPLARTRADVVQLAGPTAGAVRPQPEASAGHRRRDVRKVRLEAGHLPRLLGKSHRLPLQRPLC